MKFNPKALPITSKALFTIVGGVVLINPVYGQEQSSEELEEVVVTGLRGSLKASMETKRDAIGVVDAINAEDIGKFPDTNLSESLQRITGVSIDRRNGEGALVTARGFGPQFNMITLNGRQMPAADTYGAGDAITGGVGGNSRAFNFANLAAEAVNAVEVYKTGRADVATGGIGATINIRTARPLDNDGMVLNLGVKAVNDTTNRVGDDFTPELSGIFGWANDSKTLGFGVSASYAQRDSGSSSSTVNDWHIQAWDGSNNGINQNNVDRGPMQTIASVPSYTVVNQPANGQLYGIPNDIRYAFSDSERTRTNMQATVQFAPIETLTLTVDYTYALNELTEDRGEQTIWLQRNGFDHLEFDTGQAVATPIVLHEFTGASKDFGFEQQHREHRNDLNSIGFNASWDVAENFNLGFDFHNSRAGSHPDDGVTGGSQTSFSLAGKVPSAGIGANPGCGRAQTGCTNFWTQTFMFNDGLPVAARTLFPTSTAAYAGTGGNNDYSFGPTSLGSQILRINYQEQNTDIKQSRIDGKFTFENGSTFGFGVETRAMSAHQLNSNSNLTMGDWGVSDTGNVPDMVALLTPFSLTGAFDDFTPVGAPTGGWKGNANVLGQWALDHGYTNWTEGTAPDGQLRFNPGFNTDSTVEEDTQAVYAQLALKFDVGSMPSNLVVGARYEQTDVHSVNLQLIPTSLLWQDDNDFQVNRSSTFTPVEGGGSYNNLLPNLDFDIGLSDSLKARFSYSKTIARAGYGTLTAGQAAGGAGGSTINGFLPTGNQNNPGILPLESDNFDISVEYYFSDTGYVSLGAFQKNVENFIGNAVEQINLFGIRNQTGGPSAQAALAFLQSAQCTAQNGGNACGRDDSALFTATAMLINPGQFTDPNGTWTGGLANYNGSNAQHVAFATKYDILPTANDPLYIFNVNTPVNNKEAKIHGFEMGGQYFFGESGFGILANYTIVEGDVGYDVTSDPNVNQFALTGLSDSANAVIMFEKFGLSARLAYNWRDQFLQNVNQGGWRNPIFVEEYDQIDLSVGYDINDNFAVSFEAINLAGEDVRWHGRSVNQLWRLEDQGSRYALGARYKF
jgi:TonB-dependent receptor